MGLFGNDANESKTKVSTTNTTTQVDRRIGADGRAMVAAEGGQITNRTSVKVSSADAAVVRAALAGSTANYREALTFSTRQAEQSSRLVEAALANTGGDLAGLQTLVKGGTMTAIALAIGALLLFRR